MLTKTTKVFVFFAALMFGCPTSGSASPHISDLRISGLKYPNSREEGDRPVKSTVFMPGPDEDWRNLPGYSELVPYLLLAPDQEEAGSCLYMSLTGVAEWWLARLHPRESRASEGPLDLSERHLMNIAGLEESENGVTNWKTDSIRLFNRRNEGWRNRSYRFTKGWARYGANGYVATAPEAAGATYDATYNWIDQMRTARPERVRLPEFTRSVIFADPASNQWNVGVMPRTIVATVKRLLQQNQAPVHVIYNHYGYWHAVFILGYDDNRDTQGCPFVSKARTYFPEEIEKLRTEISSASTQADRDRLTSRLNKFTTTLSSIERSIAARGDCNPRGVFYVRDSIYGVEGQPLYDYDPRKTGEETPYSAPIIFREYSWLEHFGNHATQIRVVQ